MTRKLRKLVLGAEDTQQHIRTLSCCSIQGEQGKGNTSPAPPDQGEPATALLCCDCELESSVKPREADALVSHTDF